MPITYSEAEAADALITVLPGSTWVAVGLAHGFRVLQRGGGLDDAAQAAFDAAAGTRRWYRGELAKGAPTGSFVSLIPSRDRTGAAENPVTKLFPAEITEQLFKDQLDDLRLRRPTLHYEKTSSATHTLVDFLITEGDDVLPVNVKNAGTPEVASEGVEIGEGR